MKECFSYLWKGYDEKGQRLDGPMVRLDQKGFDEAGSVTGFGGPKSPK